MTHEIWIDKNDGRGTRQKLIDAGNPAEIITIMTECVANGWFLQYLPAKPEKGETT